MKNWTLILAAVITLALVVDVLMAQPPGGREQRPRGPQAQGQGERGGRPGGPGGQQGERGQQPGERPGGFGRPQNPLFLALDADKDGELSAEEIENAAAALKKLDKNGDGRLDRDELRPQFAGPGGGAERLMQFDRNGNGKVEKDELPEQMQRILQRVDTDGDGAISEEEAQKAAEQFQRGDREGGVGGGSRQRGPGGGGRPAGPGGGGDRPERPQRPGAEYSGNKSPPSSWHLVNKRCPEPVFARISVPGTFSRSTTSAQRNGAARI